MPKSMIQSDTTTCRDDYAPLSLTTAKRSQVELLVTGGNRSARRLRLQGNHWTIGAGLECSIRIDGFDIQPVHAELTIGNDGLRVLGRPGRISVNGTIVQEAKLFVQDHFEVGGYRFQVSRLELPTPSQSIPQLGIDLHLGRISFSQQMRMGKGKREPQSKRPFAPQQPFPQHPVATTAHSRRAPMVDPGLALEHRLLQLEDQLRATAEQAARLAVADAERSRVQTADLIAERTRLQESATQLELRVDELEEAVEQSHREAHAERQAQRKSLAQIQELENTLSSLKDQSRSEREQLQSQAFSLQQTIDRLAASIEHERNQWAQQQRADQEQTARLQTSIDDLTRQWREAQAALAQSCEELRTVHEQLQIAQGEREQAHEQARELEERLLEVSAALEHRPPVGDDQELHSRLTTVQDELRSVREELKILSVQRDDLREAVLTLEEKLKHVSKEREMVQAVCDRQARDMEAQDISLRDQGRKLREEQANWERERASLQDERHVLAEALAALQLAKEITPISGTGPQLVDCEPRFSVTEPETTRSSGSSLESASPSSSSFEEPLVAPTEAPENEQSALPSWWTTQPEPRPSTEATYFEASSAFDSVGEVNSSSIDSAFEGDNSASWSIGEAPWSSDPLANVMDGEMTRSLTSPEMTLPEMSPPESAADILARMGHTLAEESAPVEPVPTSAKPTNHFRHEPTSGDEDEASIEEYMNRLLQRMQGREEPPPTPVGAAATPAPKTVPTKSMTETVPLKPRVKTVELSETSEYTPRAPERTSDIAAMRELANSTARSAIAASHKRSAIGAASTKIAVCGVAAATGVTLLIWSGITLSITTLLAGICFAATVVWGFDALSTYRNAIRASQRPKQSPKGQNEPLVPESKAPKVS